jgi:hypothetical protein
MSGPDPTIDPGFDADRDPGHGGDLPGDRLAELLADRALAGVDRTAAVSLGGTLVPPSRRDESLELAAAAIDLALHRVTDPPPAHLRARVTQRLAALSAAASIATPPHQAAPPPLAALPATASTTPRGGWLPWLAAAAGLMLAAIAWWPAAERSASLSQESPESWIARIESDPSTSVYAAACTDDPLCTGAGGGEIVWNPLLQQGFVKIRGVASNDPCLHQYQLWIVDSTRDARFPIDGGIFDIPDGSGEVIVPIRAALPVGDAALFAVSVEKPGGVVVSDRRFVLVAPATKG